MHIFNRISIQTDNVADDDFRKEIFYFKQKQEQWLKMKLFLTNRKRANVTITKYTVKKN